MQDLSIWSKEDFLALVCICGAKADLEITDDEVAYIVDKFGAETYERARSLHDQQSDYENLQAMIQLKQRLYPEGSAIEDIKTHLKSLFEIDGNYSFMEKVFQKGINRLM